MEINGRWYTGSENCPSKREAEHSAAERAYHDLTREDVIEEHVSIDPEAYEEDVTKHFPPEYADIENHLVSMLAPFGGRIRKVRPRNSRGMILVEISGQYRYCHKIERDHTHNQVYFLVDPRKQIYYQRCHDPDCRGYQSPEQLIYPNSTNRKSLCHSSNL